jgi:hypothetical protein
VKAVHEAEEGEEEEEGLQRVKIPLTFGTGRRIMRQE